MKRTQAFTLLEVLVASTLTLLIAAVMISVAVGVLGTWRRTQAAHTQAAAARQVFDQIEQDLQAACLRRDSTNWLAVEILDSAAAVANHGWLIGPGVMKPAGGGSLRLLPESEGAGISRIAAARFGLSGCWLRFVTSNVEAGGALPVVVAYQVARRPITGDPVSENRAPVRYSLYRSAVDAPSALSLGYAVTANAYTSPDNRPFSALSSAYRQPRNVMNPSHANLLAANVVDFGVWLHIRGADGALRRVFPANATDLQHHATGNQSGTDGVYPQVVDVFVRILSEEGATLVEAIETGRGPARPPAFASDDAWWWSVVEANSRVFVQRIEIKAAHP